MQSKADLLEQDDLREEAEVAEAEAGSAAQAAGANQAVKDGAKLEVEDAGSSGRDQADAAPRGAAPGVSVSVNVHVSQEPALGNGTSASARPCWKCDSAGAPLCEDAVGAP